MKQASKHPRKTRTYKVTDLVYKKARKVANSKKVKLSTVIESWVRDFSNGMEIISYEMTYGDVTPLVFKNITPKTKK